MTPAELSKVLDDHRLWLRRQGGRHANLVDANLTDAHLARANLAGANLTWAHLAWAHLAWANLTGANLAGANLTWAHLAGANLTGAHLAGANLTGANLAGANLAGANLTWANLTGANLAGANLTRAVGIHWGQIGPVGKGRRLLTAWAHDSLPEPVIAGGCFKGTFDEFRATVAGEPWEWPGSAPVDIARWRAECLAAADLLELAVQP